jgi:hypothetical protein
MQYEIAWQFPAKWLAVVESKQNFKIPLEE